MKSDGKKKYPSSVKKMINLFEEKGLDKDKKALLTHLSMPEHEQLYVLRYHLFLLAQTYYQLVGSVANAPVGWMDYTLNHYYGMVVKSIQEFLNMPEFKDLHVEFHPLANLFPGNDLDMAWDCGVRQEIQNFVGDTQSFLNELNLIEVCNSDNVKMMTSYLNKTMEKPLQAANEHSQRAEKGFNKILDKTKRELSESMKTTKQTQENLPCTKKEYNQFTLIHGRLKDLMKLLRNSDKDEDKIAYKQIELDEDVTEFWPTIENIGRSVGINVSGKLDVIKEIIFDKEIQTSLSGVDLFSAGCYIDGKHVDEIELAEMMRKEEEKAAKPRNDLIQDLDRIMVRLAKCFGVNKETKLQQPSPEKPAETKHGRLQQIIEVLENWQKSAKKDKDLETAKLALPPIAETYDILCRLRGQCEAKTTNIIGWLGSATQDGGGYYPGLLNKFANPEVIADLEKWQKKPAEPGPEVEPDQPDENKAIGNDPYIKKTANIWMFSFNNNTISIADRIGSKYIAFLLTHPGEYDAHILELNVFRWENKIELPGKPEDIDDGLVISETGLASKSKFNMLLGRVGIDQLYSFITTLENKRDSAEKQSEKDKCDKEIAIIKQYLKKAHRPGDNGRPIAKTFDTDQHKAALRLRKSYKAVFAHIKKDHEKLSEHLKVHMCFGVKCWYRPPDNFSWNFF